MRYFLILATCCAGFAQAPWRAALQGLPAQAPRNTSVQNIENFTQNVRLAAPYFATLRPGDYQANRDLVRRMVTYLAGVDAMTSDPRMRSALSRAYLVMGALNFGQPGFGQPNLGQPGESAPPARDKPIAPPFAMRVPPIEGVTDEDKKTAADLTARYSSAATEAAGAWQSADVLRRSLENQGMTLNDYTAISLTRMQLYFELAAEDLRARDWPNAKTNIERAGYETQKVFKTVGR